MPVSERSKWNLATSLLVVVLLVYLGTATWALFASKVTFTEWAALFGPVAGAVMGWVGRWMTTSGDQP